MEDIKEFLGHVRRMRRGDRVFRHGIITSIVARFDEYFSKVLRICFRLNPGWLKNTEKKMSYKELLEIKSLDDLKEEIISKEIDGLMRDSHHAQITFLDEKLKIGVEEHFSQWKEFLEITERRNLFVHTGGQVSSQYLNNCAKWQIQVNSKIDESVKLSANDNYITKAIDCFYELAVRTTQAVARRIFPQCLEDADRILNNQSVDDLLAHERWALADRIFEFALGIPEKLVSPGEWKYPFLINRCIAKKFNNQPFTDLLHSILWTAFHPKYHFAVAILEDKFDLAIELLRSEAVKEAVTETSLRDWPLLREFRKLPAFQSAFKEIFGKDFTSEYLAEIKKEISAEAEQNHPTPPPNGQ